jgi:hypothetical protein
VERGNLSLCGLTFQTSELKTEQFLIFFQKSDSFILSKCFE